MDIQDWEIIYKLFLHKNITKTAKELYISQPRLTTKIKVLEEELGVTLIERNNKGIEFTSTGNYVAQYAKAQFNSFRMFKEDIRSMTDGLVGNLRLVAPYVVVKYQLPKMLLKFQKLHPMITFDISTVHSGEVVNYLKSHFYHFGFIRNSLAIEPENMLRIETGGISIVCREKFEVRDLPGLRRIDYQTDNYYHGFLEEWWNSHFKEPGVIGIRVNDLESCREMIFAGLGYGILPDLVLSGEHDLCVHPLIDSTGHPFFRHTWMVYQDDILQRQVSKAFYDFVKDYIN